MIGVSLAVVAAVAVASKTAEASPDDDYDLHSFCSRINEQMMDEPASWANSIAAYETAMKYVKSLSNQFNSKRRGLAKAWRAVTYDEPCSSKSLAHVQAIYACRPSVNRSQRHLDNDARKYAQKCLRVEHIGEEFRRKYAGGDVEKFLASGLLEAYRRANPNGARLHFEAHVGADSCCKPERATKVLAEAVNRDFPEEAARFKEERSFKLVGEFLTQHLYKPCDGYVKRVDKIMDKIHAASYYALDDDARRLPQDIQDAVFRFKFCRKLNDDFKRSALTKRVTVLL